MTSELQNDIQRAINTWDSPSAIHILGMAKKDPSFELDPKIALQLRFVRMNSLSPEQLLKLMGESLLAAYVIPDFDLDERVKDYLDQLDNVGEEIQFTNALLKTLDASEELLGSANITLNGISVKPTLGNWIDDFAKSSSGGQEKDALAEIEYLNKSPNVKSLSEGDKNILKNLIKLYDHAVHSIALFNSIEVPKSDKELSKDYDLYRLIPGLEDDLAEEAELKNKPVPAAPAAPLQSSTLVVESAAPSPVPAQQPTSQPVAPVAQSAAAPLNPPPTAEQRRVIDDISRSQTGSVSYNGDSGPARFQVNSSKIYEMINHRNLQSKPGVKKDPTNIKMDEEKKRMNAELAKQADDIQIKLEELRQRNKKEK